MIATNIDNTWFCVEAVPGVRRLLRIAFCILPDCLCRTQRVDILVKGVRPRN